MRQWMGLILGGERAPDAYAAIAFWFDAEQPGRPHYQVGFLTRHDAVPSPVLCGMAARYLAEESAVVRGAQRATEDLGYEHESWEPDPVA